MIALSQAAFAQGVETQQVGNLGRGIRESVIVPMKKIDIRRLEFGV
jgi:hypothetical protein